MQHPSGITNSDHMKTKALSTLAGMPVRHYQLFRFSLASEAVLPDNRIVSATPLPTLCIGTVYGNSVCPSGTAR